MGLIMIDNIIKELLFLLKKREWLEKAFNDFVKAATEDSSAWDLYIWFDSVEGFIRGIEMFNNDLANDLSWYIYETDQLKDWEEYNIEVDWKKYKIKTLQDFVKYLKNQYE